MYSMNISIASARLEIDEDKVYFIFEDNIYPIDYCCQCETFIISCCTKDCTATSCNGNSCPKCHTAHEEFWKIATPLSRILEKSCIARRKYEKEEYAAGVHFISFFDHLGVDWENGERPKGWS